MVPLLANRHWDQHLLLLVVVSGVLREPETLAKRREALRVTDDVALLLEAWPLD